MKKIADELIQEVIRLRKDCRCSINEIVNKLKLGKGTISKILKPYPITNDEIHQRCSENAIVVNKKRTKPKDCEKLQREKKNKEEEKFGRKLMRQLEKENEKNELKSKMEKSPLNKQRNKRKQGDVGLGIAIGWFSAHEYDVCIPLTDNQIYDLIVCKDDSVYKVQVKTSAFLNKNNRFHVMLKTCGGFSNYEKLFDNKKIDYLFVLTAEMKMYLIPSKDVDAKHGVVLSRKYDDYVVTWI